MQKIKIPFYMNVTEVNTQDMEYRGSKLLYRKGQKESSLRQLNSESL